MRAPDGCDVCASRVARATVRREMREMEPIGYHTTLRLEEDRPIATSPAERRLLAKTVLTVARAFKLLAFRWADTHGHFLCIGDRATCAELARRIEIAIQVHFDPGVRFARPRFKPVFNLWHLQEAAFYIWRQDKRHGFGNDPHHDASNVPDLLGARVNGIWTAPIVREHLSRIGRDELLEAAGWTVLGEGGPELLVDACVSAACLPDLSGRTSEVVATRRAAVVALPERTSILAGALGVTKQAIRKMRRAETNPLLVRAIQMQLRIRSQPVPDKLLDPTEPTLPIVAEPRAVYLAPRITLRNEWT